MEGLERDPSDKRPSAHGLTGCSLSIPDQFCGPPDDSIRTLFDNVDPVIREQVAGQNLDNHKKEGPDRPSISQKSYGEGTVEMNLASPIEFRYTSGIGSLLPAFPFSAS